MSNYDPALFANRKDEVEQVCQKISRLLEGTPVPFPHTAFHGPRGCGKSWLLSHLQRVLPQKFRNQIRLAFSSLDPNDPYLTENTLRSASSALGLRLPAVASVDEMSALLTEHCRRAGCPVVILVDELDKVPPEVLKELELYYIAPLYRLPNVLFILGSRVPAPGGRLNDVAFKRRVENRELPPFDLQQTEEQIHKLGVDRAIAQEILDVGGGYPISNAILAQGWAVDPGKALEKCAQALLEGIPEDLQRCFRALCLADTIERDRMPCLLATYFNDDPSHWDIQRCQRILMDMVRTYLVRWRQGTQYVMDPAVRQVLRSALQRNYPNQWEKLLECLK